MLAVLRGRDLGRGDRAVSDDGGDIAQLWSPEAERAALTAAVAAACRDLAATRPPAGGAARRSPGWPATSTRWPGCRPRPATTWTCSGGRWCARPRWAARPPPRPQRLLARDPDPDAGSARWRCAPPPRRRREGGGVAGAGGRPYGADRLVRTDRHGVLAPRAGRAAGPVRARSTSDLVPGLDRGGMIMAMTFTGRLFPRSASTRPSSTARGRRPGGRPGGPQDAAGEGRPGRPDAALPRDRGPLTRLGAPTGAPPRAGRTARGGLAHAGARAVPRRRPGPAGHLGSARIGR